MSRYKNMVLTSKGRQMLAKLMKRECGMVVTRAAIGCGSYDGTEDLSLAEGLKGFIRSFGISSFEREDDQLLLRFVASNFDLETNAGNETDYYLTEIGIYARESEVDEDFLYAIAVADVPAFLPAYDEASPVTITFSSHAYIGNEGDVLIHADPTAYALATDLQAHEENEENPHKVTKKQVGLEYADNTSDLQKPVSVAQKKAIDDAQADANQFTLQKITDLINGAPETLDTLKDVADAIKEHSTVMDALDAAIGKKANQSELKTVAFTGKYEDLTDKPTSMPANGGTAKTISETLPISKGGTGKTTANDAANELINGLAEGTDTPNDADYYVSQFAGGGTAIKTYHRRPMSKLWDYIKSKLAAVATSGSYNDLSNKPTIPSKTSQLTNDSGFKTTDTVYTHPTSAGNKHIPAGGASGQILRWSADGTAVWGSDNNTNTWRGIQNNLTSDSTTDSLSAAQGKALKALIDGKAASSHTHSYLPISGGTVTGDLKAKGKISQNASTATGTDAAAFGDRCKAPGKYAFVAGSESESGAIGTVAMGCGCNAPGNYGIAFGYATIASYFQMVVGSINRKLDGPSSQGAKSGTAFVIGNGTSTTDRSNAFRVTGAGQAYACSAFNSSGADYAEFFEWWDGNADAEDRRGYFVTLCGDKIKPAEPGDYILGVVSAHPTVIGNSDEDWTGRYVTDKFGSYVEETYEYDEISIDENGEETTTRKTGVTWKENPDYDPEMTYIQRADRAEWDAVGMMGVLSVRDDGSCEVNGYCTVAEGGIATACSRLASPDVYRVIARSGHDIVKIVVK